MFNLFARNITGFNMAEPALLESVSFADHGEGPNRTLLEFKGQKTGFIAWLLGIMGLTDRTINFSISPNNVIVREGKELHLYPTREITDIKAGYGSNKSFLVGVVIFILMAIPTFGISLLFAGLFIWLYKRSGSMYVSLSTFNGTHVAVNFKTKKFGGVAVSSETVQELIARVQYIAQTHSRYYAPQLIDLSEL